VQQLWVAVDTLSELLDDPDDFEDEWLDAELGDRLAEPGAVQAALQVRHPAAREVWLAAAALLDDAEVARALRRGLNGRSGNPARRGKRRR
jgi:hypothetical protein